MPNTKLPSPVQLPVSPETEESTAFESQPTPMPKYYRTLPLIFGLLVAVSAGWFGNWWITSRSNQNAPASEASANQPQAVPVKVTTVEKTLVADSSEVVGTLEARRSAIIKPEIEGRISEILVQEGDRVREGQVIFRMASSDWEAELLEAKAKLANGKARLAELEAGSRSEDIEEGKAQLKETQARLKNAQGGARPEEIAQARAQLDDAQAKADLAKRRVERYRQLSLEGAISSDQFQEYLTEERSAIASLEQAQGRLAELNKSRSSDIDELQASVEQAKQNLRRLENGPRRENIAQAKAEVAEAAAQVRIAEVNVQKTRILAPTSGVIGDIPIKLGEYVSDGDTLTTITANNTLELNLSIPIEQAAQLRLGLPVEIVDGDNQIATTGKISFISPQVNGNSQLILAKATFSNVRGDLLNRQFIQAKVIWDKRPGILVPSAAISRLGGQTFVFVAQAGESGTKSTQLVAQQKKVKLGNLYGNNYQVLAGLEPGAKIVTAGILNLRDGAKIQVLSE